MDRQQQEGFDGFAAGGGGRRPGRHYRAVYTVKFAQAVFVLHCFNKKSKRGIETPKEEMDIIRARLKVAEALAKEL